jgi:hypothetical protein
VFPHFQPVIAVETLSIYGSEVLKTRPKIKTTGETPPPSSVWELISTTTLEKVENRKVAESFGWCRDEPDKTWLAQILDLLADCRAVVCRKAGKCALELGAAKGLLVLEMEGGVPGALAESVRLLAWDRQPQNNQA